MLHGVLFGMPFFVISFISSVICTLLLIRFSKAAPSLVLDSDFTAPQKFHNIAVARVGGLGVLFGLILTFFYSFIVGTPKTELFSIILIGSLPAFIVGILEDCVKSISVRIRLIFVAIAALIPLIILGIYRIQIDIPVIDSLLGFSFFSVLFLIFSTVGLVNAYNIIDGFNGLASMVGIIALGAIAYVAFCVGDAVIPGIALALIGSILGFFVWNYPRGLIFLGDGGSYLIGYWVAILSIILVYKYPIISPWFALLVNGYPIFETLFSIWRKKLHRGMNPSVPDGIHFHMLVYRRVAKWARISGNDSDSIKAYKDNARTSPYLWVLSSVTVMPALLFWRNTAILQLAFFLFSLTYLFLYRSLVQFKTPKWLRRNYKT